MEPEEDQTYDPQNDVDVIKVDDDQKKSFNS